METGKKGVIEAALFIANRAVGLEELAQVAKLSIEEVEGLLAELADDFKQRGSALEVTTRENPEKLNRLEAKIEVKQEFVQPVASLSEKVELNKKSMKILALVAKKKKLLQSELKYYFKGDVYEHVDELVKQGYLATQKYKNTRELKPTKLFYERFRGFE